jgi:hypothetical protein
MSNIAVAGINSFALESPNHDLSENIFKLQPLISKIAIFIEKKDMLSVAQFSQHKAHMRSENFNYLKLIITSKMK